jgi:hypothetical protein
MKPNALTRRWDVYLKEGGNDYGSVNPQNFRLIFTNQQLLESLRAIYLFAPAERTLNDTQLNATKLCMRLFHLSLSPSSQFSFGMPYSLVTFIHHYHQFHPCHRHGIIHQIRFKFYSPFPKIPYIVLMVS